MSIIQRILNAAVGAILMITGLGIIYAFHTLPQWKAHDIWDAGFLLITEAYSLVGSLFILLGLRYALGDSRFIQRTIARSLRHFVVVVVLLSLAILGAVMFAFRPL